MSLSNCTLFRDSSLPLSRVLSETPALEDLEEKVVPNLYLIAGGNSGNTYLWPVFRQEVFVSPAVKKIQDSPCMFIDTSSYCNLIAICSQDRTVNIWKTDVCPVCSD